MGTGHTIRCKHCGTEFIHLVGLGFMGFDCEDGFCHVETETAIRCPAVYEATQQHRGGVQRSDYRSVTLGLTN